MTTETLFTAGVVAFAIFIMYKNFRKKSSGSCGCGNCNDSKRKTNM